jgi:DNA-binding FadR family transcriptional regulator
MTVTKESFMMARHHWILIEAYNVLEADGLVKARQGSGHFVSPALILPLHPFRI